MTRSEYRNYLERSWIPFENINKQMEKKNDEMRIDHHDIICCFIRGDIEDPKSEVKKMFKLKRKLKPLELVPVSERIYEELYEKN